MITTTKVESNQDFKEISILPTKVEAKENILYGPIAIMESDTYRINKVPLINSLLVESSSSKIRDHSLQTLAEYNDGNILHAWLKSRANKERYDKDCSDILTILNLSKILEYEFPSLNGKENGNVSLSKEASTRYMVLNFQDSLGDTPLHKAIQELDVPAVEILLQLGVDRYVVNNMGKRAQFFLHSPFHKYDESSQKNRKARKIEELLRENSYGSTKHSTYNFQMRKLKSNRAIAHKILGNKEYRYALIGLASNNIYDFKGYQTSTNGKITLKELMDYVVVNDRVDLLKWTLLKRNTKIKKSNLFDLILTAAKHGRKSIFEFIYYDCNFRINNNLWINGDKDNICKELSLNSKDRAVMDEEGNLESLLAAYVGSFEIFTKRWNINNKIYGSKFDELLVRISHRNNHISIVNLILLKKKFEEHFHYEFATL